MIQDIDNSKKNAGYFAADLVQDGMFVGLGTGSTVFFAMERLSERISSEGLNITGVPTSYQATMRAREYGIPLSTLDEHPCLDIAIDGADKIDSSLRMIKGRGAAQTMERCVADASELFIVVADESKMCEKLHGPVPVEVIPFAFGLFERRIWESRMSDSDQRDFVRRVWEHNLSRRNLELGFQFWIQPARGRRLRARDFRTPSRFSRL